MKNVNTELRKLAKFLQSRGYSAHANEIINTARALEDGGSIRKMATGSPGPTRPPGKPCSYYRGKAGGTVNHNSAQKASVKKIQTLVGSLNRKGKADGCYGPSTKNKVISYAADNGKTIAGLENGDNPTDLYNALVAREAGTGTAATTGPALPEAAETYSLEQMMGFLTGQITDATGKNIKDLTGMGLYSVTRAKEILEKPQYPPVVSKLMREAGIEPASAGGASALPTETMSPEERQTAVLSNIASMVSKLKRSGSISICVAPQSALTDESITVNRIENSRVVLNTTTKVIENAVREAGGSAPDAITKLTRDIAGILDPAAFNLGGPVAVAEVYLALLEVGGNPGRANGIRTRARKRGTGGEDNIIMACTSTGRGGEGQTKNKPNAFGFGS